VFHASDGNERQNVPPVRRLSNRQQANGPVPSIKWGGGMIVVKVRFNVDRSCVWYLGNNFAADE
jgi:hypothetical protein